MNIEEENPQSPLGDEESKNLQQPDRPLECSECRKPIAVKYTEIVGNAITHTSMCNDCPILRIRLHGTPHLEYTPGQQEIGAGLACGNCGVSLNALRMGALVGCEACYEVFDDILIPEMLAAGRISPRFESSKKSTPVHIGRSPGEAQEISPSLRLLALNEALDEMLKTEDYEQAAWLRDQIKALTEQTDEKNPPNSKNPPNPSEGAKNEK